MNKISLFREKMSQGHPRSSVIWRRVQQPQNDDQIPEELQYSYFKVLTTHYELDFNVICFDGKFKIHRWLLLISSDFFRTHLNSDCDCIIFSELNVDDAKLGFQMLYTGETKTSSITSGIEIMKAFNQIGYENTEMTQIK